MASLAALWARAERNPFLQLLLVLVIAVSVLGLYPTTPFQYSQYEKWRLTGDTSFLGDNVTKDFTYHWVFARMAAEGRGSDSYHLRPANADMQPYFPAGSTPKLPNLYPPVHMLLMYPLTHMDILPAYQLYRLAGVICLFVGLFALFGMHWVLALSLFFAPLYVCLEAGQNGLFLTGLMALGLAWRKERPLLSGLAFGCLIFKPHFFILVVPWLLLQRRLDALVTTLAMAATLIAASLYVFGMDVWWAYGQELAISSGYIMNFGTQSPDLLRWQSLFAALVRLGMSLSSALQLHMAIATVLIARIMYAAWREGREAAFAPFILGIVLLPPYIFDYDLLLLLLPLAWLFKEGQRASYAVGLVVMAIAWLSLPEINPFPTLQLMPLALLALYIECERQLSRRRLSNT